MSIYWMNKKRPEWTEGISKQLVLIGDKPVLFCLESRLGTRPEGVGKWKWKYSATGNDCKNTRIASHQPRWCAHHPIRDENDLIRTL